jgi:hypothetical protein
VSQLHAASDQHAAVNTDWTRILYHDLFAEHVAGGDETVVTKDGARRVGHFQGPGAHARVAVRRLVIFIAAYLAMAGIVQWFLLEAAAAPADIKSTRAAVGDPPEVPVAIIAAPPSNWVGPAFDALPESGVCTTSPTGPFQSYND